MKKKLLFICLFSFLFLGCTVAPMLIGPIVTGVTMWKDGEARRYYNEEPRAIYRATKISLKDLTLPIKKDEAKEKTHHIIAGDGDRFHIYIRQVKPHITEVRLRINIMGDKNYAELLYHQIDINTNTIDFDNQGNPTKNIQKK